jgi:hypothetical protein
MLHYGLSGTLSDEQPTRPDQHDAEALIREARRLRRRRWLLSGVSVIGVIVVVLGSITVSGGFSGLTGDKPSLAQPPDHVGGPLGVRPVTTKIRLPTSPEFDQVVAGNGMVLVFGNANWNASCTLARINPTTLFQVDSTIPACGIYTLYGDGAALLLTEQAVGGTAATVGIHLERVDPINGHADVLTPVCFQFVGSAAAHAAVAYGDGALWIAGDDDSRPTLVEVSPTSGRVEQRWMLPSSANAFSLAVGTRGALVAPGLGSTYDFGLLLAAPHVSGLRQVSGLSRAGWANWLVATDVGVLADITMQPSATSSSGGRNDLVQLRSNDRVRYSVASSLIGTSPIVGPDGDLWSVTQGQSGCAPEELAALSASTGVSRSVIRLASRGSGDCAFQSNNYSLVAAVGESIFVLATPGDASVTARLLRVRESSQDRPERGSPS